MTVSPKFGLVEPAPSFCLCAQCDCLLDKASDPRQLICSGDHTFCSSCFRAQERELWCGLCQFELGSTAADQPNEVVAFLVGALPVACDEMSCSWTGEFGQLKQHMRDCAEAQTSLPALALEPAKVPHEQLVEAVWDANRTRKAFEADLAYEKQQFSRACAGMLELEKSLYSHRTDYLRLADDLAKVRAGVPLRILQPGIVNQPKPQVNPTLQRNRGQMQAMLRLPSERLLEIAPAKDGQGAIVRAHVTDTNGDKIEIVVDSRPTRAENGEDLMKAFQSEFNGLSVVSRRGPDLLDADQPTKNDEQMQT